MQADLSAAVTSLTMQFSHLTHTPSEIPDGVSGAPERLAEAFKGSEGWTDTAHGQGKRAKGIGAAAKVALAHHSRRSQLGKHGSKGCHCPTLAEEVRA